MHYCFNPPLRMYCDKLMLLVFNSATRGSGTAQLDSVNARHVSSSSISIWRSVLFHRSTTSWRMFANNELAAWTSGQQLRHREMPALILSTWSRHRSTNKDRP